MLNDSDQHLTFGIKKVSTSGPSQSSELSRLKEKISNIENKIMVITSQQQ
jgi:hypothetical protein